MAAGWAVDTYSANSLSMSNSNASTDLSDVANLSVNPAIISDIKNNQLSISGSYLNIGVDYQTATDAGDAGVNNFIPAVSYAKKISKNINIGLAVSVPYGLATEYSDSWSGAAYAVESEIKSILVNPVVSYNINNKLSLAFGTGIQQISLFLTSNIGSPVEIKGDDVGYGFNTGLIYKINSELTFGLSYNSKITHKIKDGDLLLTTNMKFDSSITMPESANLGLSYDLGKNTKVFYDLAWVRWSRITDVVITDQIALNLQWKDSWKNAIAIDHKLNKDFAIKGGFAYETAAVDKNREPRTPGSDKYWLSLGTQYKINEDSTINFAYIHQFLKSSRVDLVTPAVLSAKYDVDVDIISIGYKINF